MSDATQSADASIGSSAAISVVGLYGVLASIVDAGVVSVGAVASGSFYHHLVLGQDAPLAIYAAAGGMLALVYTSLMASRKGYDPRRTFAGDLPFSDMFSAWSLSLVALIIAGFITKSTATYSRGSTVIFYIAGFAALVGVRIVLAKSLQWGVREGFLSLGRILLVGTSDRISAFKTRNSRQLSGLLVEGVYVLPSLTTTNEQEALNEAALLKNAVEHARRAAIDDVFVLVPWAQEAQVVRCGAAFMTVPARVHLGSEPILERYSSLEVESNGGISSFSLARGPLRLAEMISKRVLDIVVASIALVLLSPVLIATAVAIRWDSPGPILFRQRRNGFNQDTFEILKFRSMTVTEDGATARQATRNDARITRVGKILRRTSIDELPQLINVLLGSMSIVGPRPHPTNLDKAFETKIALYARRHNVKPGITGWAQVNGYRGETDTDEKMRARIEYDLYYVEHWSLSFDLFIMARTILSPKVFTNAY